MFPLTLEYRMNTYKVERFEKVFSSERLFSWKGIKWVLFVNSSKTLSPWKLHFLKVPAVLGSVICPCSVQPGLRALNSSASGCPCWCRPWELIDGKPQTTLVFLHNPTVSRSVYDSAQPLWEWYSFCLLCLWVGVNVISPLCKRVFLFDQNVLIPLYKDCSRSYGVMGFGGKCVTVSL